MKTRMSWLLSAFRFYVVRSLQLDLEIARLKNWPLRSRAGFLASKAGALPSLLCSQPARLRIGPHIVTVRRLTDLGTFQSSVADVGQQLVAAGLLDGPDPVVVDVGANVGQFSTAIKAFWPDATIAAFEADSDVHAVYAANAGRLGGVQSTAVAIGAAEGTATLHRHPISAMSTLRPGHVESYDPRDTTTVPVARLDDLVSHLTHIDLVKIDVEGYEIEALRGAPETLRRSRLLLVEVSLARSGTGNESEVLAVIRAAVPHARILSWGRPIGGKKDPICRDVLIDLRSP